MGLILKVPVWYNNENAFLREIVFHFIIIAPADKYIYRRYPFFVGAHGMRPGRYSDI